VSPKLEDWLESWGLIIEGPIRKSARTLLGEALDVPGAQFPVLSWVRKWLRPG
jgi:hypothetical protein